MPTLMSVFKVLSAVDDFIPGGSERIGFEYSPSAGELILRVYTLGGPQLQHQVVAELQKAFVTRFNVDKYEEQQGQSFDRTSLTIYGLKVTLVAEKKEE